MSDHKQHRYHVTVTWTGNTGSGTSGYRAYERAHIISAAGKSDIPGSSDPSFRGDCARWNPEELFIASLSACHKLWYLHLCAVEGVIVTSYVDKAEGTMIEDDAHGGRITSLTLRPDVVIAAAGDINKARALHGDAHAACFLANSVNFTVTVSPVIRHAD